MDFPKSSRIRTRWEYLRFFQGSEVKRLGLCTLFRLPSRTGEARVGITIKAKCNSVYRNKLKRQIREAFRAHRKKMRALDCNVVIPGSLKVTPATPRQIRGQLDAAWMNENHG